MTAMLATALRIPCRSTVPRCSTLRLRRSRAYDPRHEQYDSYARNDFSEPMLKSAFPVGDAEPGFARAASNAAR